MSELTLPAPMRAYGRFSRANADMPREWYLPKMPGKSDELRNLDSVELATMQILTPGDSWIPRGRGGLFLFASRLAGWDATGELHGLSGFSVAAKLQPVSPRQVPWSGLALLRDLDADDRTGVRVLVDGAPRHSDNLFSRRSEERLRDRLADMPPGWRR